MNIAIIMKRNGEEYALAKSATVERIQNARRLVECSLGILYPDAVYWISTDTVLNGEVAIHPERDKIMNRLRELAIQPDPMPIIDIEVEYERI
jgi:hypothetical protein